MAECMTIAQAAEALGISDDTLRKLINRGQVACLRIPGTRIMRVTKTELARVQAQWTTTDTVSSPPATASGTSTGARRGNVDPFQAGQRIAQRRSGSERS